MGEILGLGLSHYPGFIYPDDDMAMRVKQVITSPKVPTELKDPRNWPAPMQAEWGDDEGTTFAAKHRAQYFAGVRKLRAALDAFQPDAVIVFGDDQYENFQEDIVPPFCVYVADTFETRPFLKGRGRATVIPPNIWGEPDDKLWTIQGHPQAARHLTRALAEANFDIPYSYKFLHYQGLGHAFIRTVLYLDYDRQGWDYPMIPFHVNAYGSSLVRSQGGTGHLFTDNEVLDLPAPTPARCFELGRAVARALRASPWRVALIGSSSWSHAFLTEKNHYVWPDVATDRQRFQELQAGNYLPWRDLRQEDMEFSGQHELLNWVPLIGAMYELGQPPSWCEFIETYLMNSCKCVAIFPPAAARPTAAAAEPAAAVL